jgi:hypothetical protein
MGSPDDTRPLKKGVAAGKPFLASIQDTLYVNLSGFTTPEPVCRIPAMPAGYH